MKNLLPLTVLCALLGSAAPLFAQAPTAPKTDKERLSYAIGVDVAQTLKKRGINLDGSQFAAAVNDVMTTGKPQMTDAEMSQVLSDSFGPGKSKKEGADFLTANRTKPGVQVLPDGMQYKVIKEGTGPIPKATDTVTVKYRGTLINGTEFDNSEKHGGTATFQVNGVIPGWTEALQKMKTGSKWQLFIPSELAYGDRGAGGDIAPGTTLLFDVELVSIGK